MYSDETKRLATSNFGKGRGIKRGRRTHYSPRHVYSELCENETLFYSMTRLNVSEFTEIVENVKDFIDQKCPSQSLCVENKILLVLFWITQGSSQRTLSVQFGVSPAAISTILKQCLPVLAWYFCQFIPNKSLRELHAPNQIKSSVLSSRAIYIIDGTIHRINKPVGPLQHYTYRGDKACHFVNTHLLIDFHGRIISVATNFDGSCHDNFIRYCKTFDRIVNEDYAIGDTGYNNVGFVIAGLRKNQLQTPAHKLYDKITRAEQKPIEHVNCFIKKYKLLSKTTTFTGKRSHLVMVVLMVCGMYNYKKQNGYYTSSE